MSDPGAPFDPLGFLLVLAMHTNVVGIDPKEVEIGMRVEVAWDDVTPEISLPKFRPIQK